MSTPLPPYSRKEVADALARSSSDAMRTELYRSFEESGAAAIDGVAASQRWMRTWIDLSRRGVVHRVDWSGKKDVIRETHHGYPSFLRPLSPHSAIFRIYSETPALSDAIASAASLLPAFIPFAEKSKFLEIYYKDVTGVFITRPGADPYGVGVHRHYVHYVDFRLPEGVGLVGVNHPKIFVIPGPARIRPWIIEGALLMASGQRPVQPDYEPIIGLTRLFGTEIPEFRIPIDVVGRGTWDPEHPAPASSPDTPIAPLDMGAMGASLFIQGVAAHPASAPLPAFAR